MNDEQNQKPEGTAMTPFIAHLSSFIAGGTTD